LKIDKRKQPFGNLPSPTKKANTKEPNDNKTTTVWETDSLVDIENWKNKTSKVRSDFISVSFLELAGIQGFLETDTIELLLRDDTKPVFNKLDELKKNFDDSIVSGSDPIYNGLLLQGPPGIGKSTITLAWLEKLLLECDLLRALRWVWIHFSRGRLPKIVYMSKKSGSTEIEIQSSHVAWNVLTTLLNADATQDELPFWYYLAKEREHPHIIVIDGVLQTDDDQKVIIETLLTCHLKKRFIVMVTSIGFTRMLPEDLDASRIYVQNMKPWTLEQYTLACQDADFFDNVKAYLGYDTNSSTAIGDNIENHNKLLIEKKFYFAGSSARWMFSMHADKVKHHIDELVKRISNLDSLKNFLTGQNNSLVPHHLTITKSDGTRDFTSPYVLTCITNNLLNLAPDFKTNYELARFFGDGGLNGVLFEEDFISQCKKGTVELCYEPIHPDNCIKPYYKIQDISCQIRRGSDQCRLKCGATKNVNHEDKTVVVTSLHLLDKISEEQLSNLVQSIVERDCNLNQEFAEIVTSIMTGNWIKPESRNQGGFDLSRLETRIENTGDTKYYIHFYQATIAKEHFSKITYA
jgi:hypothetical protein